VRMTHSLYPSQTLTVPITNGAFVSTGLSDWFQPVRGVQTKKEGILWFEIQDTMGRVHWDKRYVLQGNHGGKHKFLFVIPPEPLRAKATGQE
jgi:hypothetical protein